MTNLPTLTKEEIKAKIGDGSIFGVSVDTAVFDRYGCNLDFPVLKKLDQFKTGAVRILLSEIVVNEVTSHIARDATETQRALKAAIKKHGKRWKRAPVLLELPDVLDVSGDPIEAANFQVKEYLATIDAEVVPASVASTTDELLRRYFATEPPFENNNRKKHEFPDGFALLSLEAVAKPRRKLILCISPDKGWQNFAKQSDYIVCEHDLNLVLSYFNESGRNVADQAVGLWKAGSASDLANEVERAFEYRLDDIDFHTEAASGLEFESEPISAVMQWVDLETVSDPIVIAADDESVTFTVSVEAVVAFEASFDFYVKDGIDRDYILIGTEEISTEDRIGFQIAITILRNLDPEPQIDDVEVAKIDIEANFGYIEPFPEEDPTHEK